MALGIPPARDMAELGKNPALSDVLLRLHTCKAIFEAADSVTAGDTSVTTAAITKSDTTAAVEELFIELGQQGYTVTNGSTTFTVTWGL
jgi:hypothetical protein